MSYNAPESWTSYEFTIDGLDVGETVKVASTDPDVSWAMLLPRGWRPVAIPGVLDVTPTPPSKGVRVGLRIVVLAAGEYASAGELLHGGIEVYASFPDEYAAVGQPTTRTVDGARDVQFAHLERVDGSRGWVAAFQETNGESMLPTTMTYDPAERSTAVAVFESIAFLP